MDTKDLQPPEEPPPPQLEAAPPLPEKEDIPHIGKVSTEHENRKKS